MEVIMENPNKHHVVRIRHFLIFTQYILGLVLLVLEVYERIQHLFN